MNREARLSLGAPEPFASSQMRRKKCTKMDTNFCQVLLHSMVAKLAHLSATFDEIKPPSTSKQRQVFLANGKVAGFRSLVGRRHYSHSRGSGENFGDETLDEPATPRDRLTLQKEEVLVNLNSYMDLSSCTSPERPCMFSCSFSCIHL